MKYRDYIYLRDYINLLLFFFNLLRNINGNSFDEHFYCNFDYWKICNSSIYISIYYYHSFTFFYFYYFFNQNTLITIYILITINTIYL